MYFKPLLLPLLAQVALTFIVMHTMYIKRIAEMKAKKIRPQSLDTRASAGPILTSSATASDNFSNLFESPVLFYTAMLLTMNLMIIDSAIVILAWSYVALRYIHSFIHISYNRVLHRFSVFMLSSVVLFALWVRLAWLILQA